MTVSAIECGPVWPASLIYDEDAKLFKDTNFYPYSVVAYLNKETRKPTKYVIKIALAGIRKDDILVSITSEGELSVKVTPIKEEIKDDIKVIRNRISYSNREIIFPLPNEINIKSISSEYVDGLLTIELPMIAEKSKSRVISIK